MSVLQRIKKFCENNKIDFEYKKDKIEETITIKRKDPYPDSYIQIRKLRKKNSKTSIIWYTDWNDDFEYTGIRYGFNNMINALYYEFLWDGTLDSIERKQTIEKMKTETL